MVTYLEFTDILNSKILELVFDDPVHDSDLFLTVVTQHGHTSKQMVFNAVLA
jgi:hypothetical protein